MAIKFSTLESLLCGITNNPEIYGIYDADDIKGFDIEIIDPHCPDKLREISVNLTKKIIYIYISEGD